MSLLQGLEHAAWTFTHKHRHGHGHAAWTWTCCLSLLFASYHIRFAIFASDHIRFASIRFISYSFRMPNFRIRFETNISESNPSIRYFANIYSLPDSLYSLRSEYEGTPYGSRFAGVFRSERIPMRQLEDRIL
jgi:hypothetical protein